MRKKSLIGSEKGVNFINIPEQLLLAQIPKAQKKTDKLPVFFTLLGSGQVIAALRTLMKLTPGVNFINVLHTNFSYQRRFGSLKSGFELTFVQKMRTKNVDEIDGRM